MKGIVIAIGLIFGFQAYAQEFVLSVKAQEDAEKYKGIDAEQCMPIIHAKEVFSKEPKVATISKEISIIDGKPTNRVLHPTVYINGVSYEFFKKRDGWEKSGETSMKPRDYVLKDLKRTVCKGSYSLTNCAYLGEKKIGGRGVHVHQYTTTIHLIGVDDIVLNDTIYVGIDDGRIYRYEEVNPNNTMSQTKIITDYRYTAIKKPTKIIPYKPRG